MRQQQIEEILSGIKVPITDSHFLPRVYAAVTKERKAAQAKDGDNLKRVCAEEYGDLSRRLDNTKIQESCSVRNILKTRRLANLLINDKGELLTDLLPPVISHLTEHLHSFGPQRQYDSVRHEHIIKVLNLLLTNTDLTRQLKRISKPHLNPLADQLIRDTLQLHPNASITDAHAKRAALSAWICFLRQNVGSCFATAPAIIVHSEQPEQFLQDLAELLSTGRLKRTYGGIEYSVPLSTSWGAGDLRKILFLIRDLKQQEFAVWNAPGLVIAFEGVGLLDTDSTIKAKVEKIKDLILHAFPEWNERQPYLLASAEEILRRVLLKHHQLTEQELQDFENRPRTMIHTGLLMQTTSSGMGGKSEACLLFQQQFQHSMDLFKALADNALLKAWEFSLASFSEIKSEFTRWNLYASLGLEVEEPGGIGQCLYQIIKRKLDQFNEKVQGYQYEYEQLYAQVQQLEVRMRSASSDKEAQWIRVEYQSKVNEFHLLQEMRDEAHAKAQLYANLINILIESYDKLFPQYFQEVYDADMHEVGVGPYDDSPAGFRLLYKHGRTSTAQWTKIKTPQEFVDALANFFIATEREIFSNEHLEGMESDVSEIITSVVTHVRTKEFLETAFTRMAKAHKTPPIRDPLEHLEKIEKKPWAYTSGGTMTTLVSCYYRREQKPTEVSRWVENPMELFVFLVDTLKQIPYKIMEDYVKNPDKSMLMHSPTHAFLLKPGLSPFKEAWQAEFFTYTWLRDNWTQPRTNFVRNISLDSEELDFLVQHLLEVVPRDYQHNFLRAFKHMHGPMSPSDFRSHLVGEIAFDRGLQSRGHPVLSNEDIDSTLYALLPLTPHHRIMERMQAIFSRQPGMEGNLLSDLMTVVDEHTNHLGSGYISAQQLQDICIAFLCMANEKTSSAHNVAANVAQAAQQLGFAMPTPIIFADTNWVKEVFAFVVNPGTEDVELWRVDPLGRVGAPMSSWQQWLNGTRKDAPWGIYTRPYEYSVTPNLMRL